MYPNTVTWDLSSHLIYWTINVVNTQMFLSHIRTQEQDLLPKRLPTVAKNKPFNIYRNHLEVIVSFSQHCFSKYLKFIPKVTTNIGTWMSPFLSHFSIPFENFKINAANQPDSKFPSRAWFPLQGLQFWWHDNLVPDSEGFTTWFNNMSFVSQQF